MVSLENSWHVQISKKNKPFYGCSGFPNCDFATWDLPYKDKCPTCGEMLVVKRIDDHDHIKCTKCDYSTKIKVEENTSGEEDSTNGENN